VRDRHVRTGEAEHLKRARRLSSVVKLNPTLQGPTEQRRELTEQLAYNGVPGVVVGVVSRNGLVWAKGYGTTEFDMSEARRNALVAAARQSMQDWLSAPPRAMQPAGPAAAAMAARALRRADAVALDLLE
jgi:hypothetical protein